VVTRSGIGLVGRGSSLGCWSACEELGSSWRGDVRLWRGAGNARGDERPMMSASDERPMMSASVMSSRQTSEGRRTARHNTRDQLEYCFQAAADGSLQLVLNSSLYLAARIHVAGQRQLAARASIEHRDGDGLLQSLPSLTAKTAGRARTF
jgi:hypothetical protein